MSPAMIPRLDHAIAAADASVLVEVRALLPGLVWAWNLNG
jgi:hypothetical protein